MLSEILARQNDMEHRLRRQEAKSLGPTLGEFYGQFRGLPGLRGLWYPGSLDQTGAMYDQSGQGRTLTYNGNPTLGLHNNLVPYMAYDGTGDYHSRADEAGLDILGTETYIASSLRGLTLGGWFWFDSVAGTPVCISKYVTSGNQRSYILYSETAQPTLRITSNGTASVAVVDATNLFVPEAWNFFVGRFTPSTELKVFTNGLTAVNTTSIPASIFGSTAQFDVGAGFANNNELNGRCALAFLAAAAWPDELINYLWQRSRVLFGV